MRVHAENTNTRMLERAERIEKNKINKQPLEFCIKRIPFFCVDVVDSVVYVG